MSIRDSLRVIAAEKRIEELGGAIEALAEEVEELLKRMAELDEKVSALAAVTRPAQTPQPRPPERR